MGLREPDIIVPESTAARTIGVRRPANNNEYRPETEIDRKRKMLQKACQDTRAMMGRLEQKIQDIEAACEQLLT